MTSIDRSTIPVQSSGAGPGPVAPSRALTRVTSVEPHEPTPAQPLGRSGLDLLGVLGVTDEVAVRESTGSVAREVGLEQARSSLLRNHPGDALASLDGVWEGARQSEEGWYLRSGALTALGLPGESERVAHEGLVFRPSSMALRFMQSFARLTLGDLAGARTALQPALDRAPSEPLLLVQRALVQAKQGDPKGAETQLQELAVAIPDHPAVAWGRATLRSIAADTARQLARPTPTAWTTAIPERGVNLAAVDTASVSLERFGHCLATLPATDAVREARTLMRGFSAGGALASAVTAEQSHAARVVLMTYLGAATGEGAESSAPVRSLVVQLIPLLQQERADEAERLVRRQSVWLREPLGRMLMAVIRGARSPDPAPATEGLNDAPAMAVQQVRGEAERGPLIPVRLGLALLEETSASRVALDELATAPLNTGLPIGVCENGADIRYMMSGAMRAVPIPAHGAEVDGEGWGAAKLAAASRPTSRSEGTGAPLGVVMLVALAVGAVVTGHWLVGIGLGVGAAWLGLHRRARNQEGGFLAEELVEREGARTHEQSSSQ